MTGPDFDELAGGDDLDAEQAARLRRVHDLLVAAGPPPELPPHLQEPPAERRARIVGLPRRRLGATLVLAAALAAAAFGAGYLVADRGSGSEFAAARGPIALHGAGAAEASLRIGAADAAGNRALELSVRGLPKLPAGGYYELVLTRNGEVGPPCGTFVVDGGGATVVRMTVGYRLGRWDGWAIVRDLPGGRESTPVLRT